MNELPSQASPQRHALEALVVGNRDLDRLEDLLGEFNLFEACGATRVELRHSDFLRFLLDAGENHGLGDYFLKVLLKRCLVGVVGQEVSAIDIDVADLSDAVAERERWSIDVLVYSERCGLVIAFENKIDSGEHSNQLERYRETVQREFRGYRKVLIYLTPEGDEPSDPVQWLALSYKALMDTMRVVVEARRSTLGSAVITTLEHYATMIGRHIVGESEIARLCQQIYRQHKDALDLIFEHKPDLQMDLKTVLEEEIRKHPGLLLDHCTKSAVRFFHEDWDRDPRERVGNGWTSTKRVALFELSNAPDSLKLKLIIGPVEKSDSSAIEFRKAIFLCSQSYREDFPGGMTTLYPQWTTILSRDLLKKKDYGELENIAEKAKETLARAIRDDVPRVLTRLKEVIRPPEP
jgi:hypothetical protein